MNEIKLNPREERIINILSKQGTVSSAYLAMYGGGLRFGSAIGTLRDKGFDIVTIPPSLGPYPERTNTYWYRLDDDPRCTCIADGPLYCELHREEGINAEADRIDSLIDEVKHHGPRGGGCSGVATEPLKEDSHE